MNATKTTLLTLGMAAVALTGCTWGSEVELPYESGERITEITIGGPETAATKTTLQRNGQTWWDADGSTWGGLAAKKQKDKVFFIKKSTNYEYLTNADYRQGFEFDSYAGSDKRFGKFKTFGDYKGLVKGEEYYGYYYPKFPDTGRIPTLDKSANNEPCYSYELTAQDPETIQKFISYNDARQLTGGSSDGEGGTYTRLDGDDPVIMPANKNLVMKSIFAIVEVDVAFTNTDPDCQIPFNILQMGTTSASSYPFAMFFGLNAQGYWDNGAAAKDGSSFVQCVRSDLPKPTANGQVIKYLYFVKQVAPESSYYLRLISNPRTSESYNVQINFNTANPFTFEAGKIYYITLTADLQGIKLEDKQHAYMGPIAWQNHGTLTWNTGLTGLLQDIPTVGTGTPISGSN